jgi:hypothetical protein
MITQVSSKRPFSVPSGRRQGPHNSCDQAPIPAIRSATPLLRRVRSACTGAPIAVIERILKALAGLKENCRVRPGPTIIVPALERLDDCHSSARCRHRACQLEAAFICF